MAKVLDFDDYRAFLKAVIAENTEVKAYRTKLATAAGCQRSYFSQVLNSHVEFTPDHVAGICEFLGLSPSETEYLLILLQLSRASTQRLKKILRGQLDKIRGEEDNLKVRFRTPKLSASEHEMLYFSSWTWSAIHA